MINNLMALLIMPILAQFNFTTPVYPVLNSPTPYVYSTPTPNTTVAPGAQATMAIPQSSMLSNLSTVESRAVAMPTVIAANGDQIYWRGQPILPDSRQSVGVWTYLRYFTSSAGYSFFGQFQNIFIEIGILITLAIVSILIYYGSLIIMTIIKFIYWLIRFVLKFIPFFG